MKKLPKIQGFDLTNDIHNNKQVFNSLEDNKQDYNSKKEIVKKDNLSVKEKIKNLIKSNNYIFNTEVTLVFKDKEKKCNIAGIVNNHIITMDNDIINIDEIIDLIY